MAVRQRPRRAWAARLTEVAGAGAPSRRPATGPRSRGDRGDRVDHRSAPGDRLAVDVSPGRPARPRRAGLSAVRFQDAAPRRSRRGLRARSRPIRSSRARRTCSPCGSGRAHSRAGRDERGADRPGAWRAMFPACSVRAPRRTSGPRPRRSWRVVLEVADRGEQVRSQFRGAIVEALTARLLARRRARRCDVRRERRILFDGVAGRDPPVRRDRRARRTGRGLGLQMGRAGDQRRRAPPARRRAAPCGRRGRELWSVWWSSTRSAPARSGSSARPRRTRGPG